MSTAEAGKKDLKLVYNELFSYRHWWSGLGMNVLLEKSFVLKQAKKKRAGGTWGRLFGQSCDPHVIKKKQQPGPGEEKERRKLL